MSDDWPQGWYRGESTGAPPRGGSGYPRREARPPGGRWPEQPPPGRGGGRPGPGGPGRGGPYGGRGYGPRPVGSGRRFARIAGAVVVVLVVVIVASYFWLDGKLHRTITLPTTTSSTAGTNWLITGSDSRSGLSRTQRDAMHVGSNTGTLNSDSIMLLHTGSGTPVLLSIPRDSYVEIPGYGHNKLNAALGLGGAPLLAKTLESVTGLTINHYMGIGFGGLVQVTDAIGGVQMCLPSSVNDSYSGVKLQAGCQNLNGDQALSFVRDRHSFATGDLQRIQDQRAYLRALLNKAVSPGVFLNPFTAYPFGSAAAGAITVDKDTQLYQLIGAAFALQNPESGTVPISDPAASTGAGEAVLWDRSAALQLFNALKNDQPVPSDLLKGTKVG